jgi:hypothetical protein
MQNTEQGAQPQPRSPSAMSVKSMGSRKGTGWIKPSGTLREANERAVGRSPQRAIPKQRSRRHGRVLNVASIRAALCRVVPVLEICNEVCRAVHAVGGLFLLVLHPPLRGKPSRALMREEFFDFDYVSALTRSGCRHPIEGRRMLALGTQQLGRRLDRARL